MALGGRGGGRVGRGGAGAAGGRAVLAAPAQEDLPKPEITSRFLCSIQLKLES